MYKKLSEIAKKPLPMAEIHTQSAPGYEEEFYFQMLSDYGIRLNEPQKEAVKAVEGPVLVIAGAGSGKTTVLTSRIGYMIHEKNIDPTNILLVTFTRKASIEMIERLARIPGINRAASRTVNAGTYHSICLRILRNEGYDFRVLSSDKRQHYIIKIILKRMGLQDLYTPESILTTISNWKNNLIRPQDLDEEDQIAKELKEVYKQYEKYKEHENLLDFDDFLVETYYLLKFNPDILEKYQNISKYILCDEFQDTSRIQYEIIRMLAEPHNNLCIVGDDAQNIYSFRSSSVDFMLNFDKEFPDCKKIIMDINYRSTPNITGLANEIIKHNKKQIKKDLKVVHTENYDIYFARPYNSDQEAEWIVNDIKDKQLAGLHLKDMAVIYRTHATGRAIFDKLLMADIPFVTYGRNNESFYQNQFVRPALAILRLAVDSNNIDAMIEAAPVLYISKNEMEKTIEEVVFYNGGYDPDNLFSVAIKWIANRKSGFQQNALLSKLSAIQSLRELTAPMAIREIRCGVIDYEHQLEIDERKTLTIHKEMVREILDEFEQAARPFKTVESFLDFVEKVEEKNAEMEELRKDPNIEAVRLMTIHASKGLEFETVYAIGMIENILPHSAAISPGEKEDSLLTPEEALEEERRLAYVCVTRAKRYLYISAPKTHRNKDAEISRFLLEGVGHKEKMKANDRG